MEQYMMRIHPKAKTERNPTIAVIVCDMGDGCWNRVLHHRGISPFWLLERPMIPQEIELNKKCWRMHYIAYKTWEGLIEDEYLVTGDIEWCMQIHAASGYYMPFWQTLSLDVIDEYKTPVLKGKKEKTDEKES